MYRHKLYINCAPVVVTQFNVHFTCLHNHWNANRVHYVRIHGSKGFSEKSMNGNQVIGSQSRTEEMVEEKTTAVMRVA